LRFVPDHWSRDYLLARSTTWCGDERDNPTMIVTLDSKRRLIIPASLAPASPGEYFDARFDPRKTPSSFGASPARKTGGVERVSGQHG
jgi:hypothetical protein